MNYTVDHMARTTLIDEDGKMRLIFGFQNPPKDIARTMAILLGQ